MASNECQKGIKLVSNEHRADALLKTNLYNYMLWRKYHCYHVKGPHSDMQLLIVCELGTIRVRSLICRNNYIVSGDDNLDSILRRRKEEKKSKVWSFDATAAMYFKQRLRVEYSPKRRTL